MDIQEVNKSHVGRSQATRQTELTSEDLFSLSITHDALADQCDLNVQGHLASDMMGQMTIEPAGPAPPYIMHKAGTVAEVHQRRRRTETKRATITVAAKRQLTDLWAQYQEKRSLDWYAKQCNIKSSSVSTLLWRLRRGEDITQTKPRGRPPMINPEVQKIIMDVLKKPEGTMVIASQTLAAAHRPISVPTISRAFKMGSLPALSSIIPLRLEPVLQSVSVKSTSKEERIVFLQSLIQAARDLSDAYVLKRIPGSHICLRLFVFLGTSEWNFGPYKHYGTTQLGRGGKSFSRKYVTKLTALTAVAGFPLNRRELYSMREGSTFSLEEPTGNDLAGSVTFPLISSKFLIGKPAPSLVDQWLAVLLSYLSEWRGAVFVMFSNMQLTVAMDDALRQHGRVVMVPHALNPLSPISHLSPHISATVHDLDIQHQPRDADAVLSQIETVVAKTDLALIQEAIEWSCAAMWGAAPTLKEQGIE